MFGTCIYMQFCEHCACKLVVGHHAFYGVLDEEGGILCTIVRQFNVAFAVYIAGIVHVFFSVFLFACDANFLGVNDDNMIAVVHIGRINRLVTAAQNIGDFNRQATEHLICRVNDIPLLIFLYFCYCSFHYCKKNNQFTLNGAFVNIFFRKAKILRPKKKIAGNAKNAGGKISIFAKMFPLRIFFACKGAFLPIAFTVYLSTYMKRILTHIIFTLSLFALNACTTGTPYVSGTKWQPVYIADCHKEFVAENGGKTPFIEFSGQNRANGMSGVNLFSCEFVIENGGRLGVGNIASTRMMGPNMEYERAFLTALSKSMILDKKSNGELWLLNSKGVPLMKLKQLN